MEKHTRDLCYFNSGTGFQLHFTATKIISFLTGFLFLNRGETETAADGRLIFSNTT
jgi:hypothetical protein